MSPKVRSILAWIVAILMGAFFIMMGFNKLNSNPEMVSEFQRWGYDPTFMKLIGSLEVLGGIGLLIPRIWYMGALGLIGLMGGAAYTHLTIGDPMTKVAFNVVLIVLLFFYMILRRK